MPKKRYEEVESDFIRKKIREGEFADEEHRSYVDALVYLEDKILNGASGYADGMRFHHTRNNLQQEYRIIYSEVAPEKYNEKLVRETVQAIEESLEPKKFKTQEIIDRLEDKHGWREVAGD